MGIPATAPPESPRGVLTHGHLWSRPDGTGLHAPAGELVLEAGTGRICCHLCGRWFVSLGSHVRRHGCTAASYREALGLCRSRPLVAAVLSRSIATRQGAVYRRSPALRARLAVGQQLAKTGELAVLASAAHPLVRRQGWRACAGRRWTQVGQHGRSSGIGCSPTGCGNSVLRIWRATCGTLKQPG